LTSLVLAISLKYVRFKWNLQTYCQFRTSVKYFEGCVRCYWQVAPSLRDSCNWPPPNFFLSHRFQICVDLIYHFEWRPYSSDCYVYTKRDKLLGPFKSVYYIYLLFSRWNMSCFYLIHLFRKTHRKYRTLPILIGSKNWEISNYPIKSFSKTTGPRAPTFFEGCLQRNGVKLLLPC